MPTNTKEIAKPIWKGKIGFAYLLADKLFKFSILTLLLFLFPPTIYLPFFFIVLMCWCFYLFTIPLRILNDRWACTYLITDGKIIEEHIEIKRPSGLLDKALSLTGFAVLILTITGAIRFNPSYASLAVLDEKRVVKERREINIDEIGEVKVIKQNFLEKISGTGTLLIRNKRYPIERKIFMHISNPEKVKQVIEKIIKERDVFSITMPEKIEKTITIQDFKTALREIFLKAEKMGKEYVDVSCGELLQLIAKNRDVTLELSEICRQAMLETLCKDDKIMFEYEGPAFTVRYTLPRK